MRREFLIIFGIGWIVCGGALMYAYLVEHILIGHPREYNCSVDQVRAIEKPCFPFSSNTNAPSKWTGQIIYYIQLTEEYGVGGAMQVSCGNTQQDAFEQVLASGYRNGGTFLCWYSIGYLSDPRYGHIWFGKKYLDDVLFWLGLAMIISGAVYLTILAIVLRSAKGKKMLLDPESVKLLEKEEEIEI